MAKASWPNLSKLWISNNVLNCIVDDNKIRADGVVGLRSNESSKIS